MLLPRQIRDLSAVHASRQTNVGQSPHFVSCATVGSLVFVKEAERGYCGFRHVALLVAEGS